MKEKQRAVMELLTKGGCIATDIYRSLKNGYDKVTIDESHVQRWMKTFRKGETRVEEKPYHWKPSTAATKWRAGKRFYKVDLTSGFKRGIKRCYWWRSFLIVPSCWQRVTLLIYFLSVSCVINKGIMRWQALLSGHTSECPELKERIQLLEHNLIPKSLFSNWKKKHWVYCVLIFLIHFRKLFFHNWYKTLKLFLSTKTFLLTMT